MTNYIKLTDSIPLSMVWTSQTTIQSCVNTDGLKNLNDYMHVLTMHGMFEHVWRYFTLLMRWSWWVDVLTRNMCRNMVEWQNILFKRICKFNIMYLMIKIKDDLYHRSDIIWHTFSIFLTNLYIISLYNF